MRKLCVIAMLVLFCCISATTQAAQVVDRIVAVVNGSMITLAEVNRALEMFLQSSGSSLDATSDAPEVQKLRKEILDNKINEILLSDLAKSYNIEVSDSEIKSYMDSFKEQNKVDDEQLAQQLAAQHLTREEFEESIRNNMLRRRIITVLVNRKVIVTDDQIRDYYEANKATLSGASGVRLRLIVFPDGADAAGVRAKIDSGELSFADAAKSMSIGPGAEQGGDLGNVELKDLVPELRDVATTLQPGQVSQPFLLKDKKAIIQLDSAVAASGPPPLEEVKDQIRAKLMEPEQDKLFQELIDRLRSNAVLDIRL